MSGKHRRTPTSVYLADIEFDEKYMTGDTDETSSEEQDSYIQDRLKWDKLKAICPGSVYTEAQKIDLLSETDYLGLVSGSLEVILSELETSTEILEGMDEFRSIMHLLLGRNLSEQMKRERIKKETRFQLLQILNYDFYRNEDSRASISSSDTVIYGDQMETEVREITQILITTSSTDSVDNFFT